ncbi:uncharacterized protein [Struthio camelus]|uniref:uncharacterized protein isoform X3 n=1 Tax=Struthio camelus TaxID=8801 RepID=UPI0036042603
MDRSAYLWLLSSFCCLWGMSCGAREVVLGTLGKATFLRIPPEFQELTVRFGTAVWKRDTEDPQSKQVLLKYSDGNYTNYMREQTRFHLANFSLEILNTSRQDRQLYEYIISKGSEEKVWQIQLEVYEPVSVPSIQVLSRMLANDSCTMTLNCTAERGDRVSYSWNGASRFCVHNGSLLHLSYNPRNASLACACTAANPISRRAVAFSASECSYEQQGGSGLRTGHVVLVVAVLVAVVMMAMGALVARPEAGAHAARRGQRRAHHLLPSAAGGEAKRPPWAPSCRAPCLHHHLCCCHQPAAGHGPDPGPSVGAAPRARPRGRAACPAGTPSPLADLRQGAHDSLRQRDTAHDLSLAVALCSGDGTATEWNGAAGKSITFRLQRLLGKHVAWHFQSELLATVKFGNPPDIIYFDQTYKSRLNFSANGTAITISQLAMEDAGIYTAKFSTTAKALFILHVYAELPQPAITCIWSNCSTAACHYSLRCAVLAPAANISYSWSAPGGLPTAGPALLLEELPPGDELPVTCTVQNPVSSSNVTVSPAAACAETSSSSQTAILVLVISAAVLSTLVICWICCKGRQIVSLLTACTTSADASAECTTVYAQVGFSRQAHLGHLFKPLQDHMQHFSNAEKNDAKTTPATSEETSKTIYSTVQAMAQHSGASLQLQMDDEKICNGVPGHLEQGEKSLCVVVSTVPALHGSMGLL